MNQIHNTNPLEVGNFLRIDINLYPLFIAIFEQKSISKAAQLLCISQSAVSHALQRLRLQLKDELFVRSGQKMLPTPFAEQIYQPIQTALSTIQNIAIPQHDFDPSMLQSLKIAIHDEIEPIIFPQLVHHFSQLNLDIQFLSSKLDRKNMLADLSAQQIDFVIDLVQPYQENLQFENLIEDHLWRVHFKQRWIYRSIYPHHISVCPLGEQDYCLKIFISIDSNFLDKFLCAVSTIPLPYKSWLSIPRRFSPFLTVF